MLAQNMAVKNGDVYGDICGEVQSRFATTKGEKDVLLVACVSWVAEKNSLAVCDERGTNGRVPKITAISRVPLVRNQRDVGLIMVISLSN
jgi:hypothetical protein